MLTYIAQFFMALAILGLLIGFLTSSGIVPVFLFSVTPAGLLNFTKAISPLAISFLLLEFLTGKSRVHKRLRSDLLKEGGEFILIRVAQFFLAFAILSLLTGLLTSSGIVPVFLFSVTPAGFLNLTKTMGLVAMSFLLLEFLTGESRVHDRHRANLSKEGGKSILIRAAQCFVVLALLGLLIGLLTSSGIVPVFLFSITPAGFLNFTKAMSLVAISFLLLEFASGKGRARSKHRASLSKVGGEFILVRAAQFFVALAIMSLLIGLLTSSGFVSVFLFSVTPAGFLNFTKAMSLVAMSFLLLELIR